MSFTVRLSMPGKTFVSVPELALQWGREGSFVWAVREGKSVQVAVRPVRRAAGRVLLDGALTTGETVVVEGVQRLREGRSVRVVGNANGSSATP
jgi:multidrug efflux pump subunit AcrA (membrane-fusion protein)